MNVVFELPDGSVTVAHAAVPRKGTPLRELYETDMDAFLDAVAARTLAASPKLTGAIVRAKSVELPGREFRAAWRSQGSGVAVDMPEARKIQMARIRAERDKKLAGLDAEEIIAISKEDDKGLADVRSRKQALRDLPETIDLERAMTPEALLRAWPL